MSKSAVVQIHLTTTLIMHSEIGIGYQAGAAMFLLPSLNQVAKVCFHS